MGTQAITGVYGKLPGYGDFVFRDLPAQFINVLDTWLQGFVGCSKEQLGPDWLDIYLTSPIWRFAFSAGVVDQSGWAGLLLPSVDRVGRYFPFLLARQLPVGVAAADFINSQLAWYDEMEALALGALDGGLSIDQLADELAQHAPAGTDTYIKSGAIDTVANVVIKMEFEEQSPAAVMPLVLDACLTNMLASYSIWSTNGSDLVEPCLFVAKGLPPLGGIAAMLDGQWDRQNWRQPYILHETPIGAKISIPLEPPDDF